ncbi:MAG: metallophosphoesterase family protein [Deltaproteobacteria bacterium]|nr:MAG: metallophosphoesterase family protein [Deltaproteobacteria bacterium]TMQ04818.1 MAG: metallophosphoesterase family protein [Deltaproteobacteria bacterium]
MTSAHARTRSRQVKQSARLALRGDGTLTIACVADTHSQPHAAIAERLAAIAPDAILHAGDIGDPAVIDGLAEAAPVLAVRGNIDTRSAFPDVLVVDVVDPGAPGPRLRIFLTHIAVNGPRLHADVARQAHAEGAALVVCGHSHVPFIGRDRDLAVFNPGSIGPRRFHLPIVLGTIAITPAAVRLAHVDCETGRPWSPP